MKNIEDLIELAESCNMDVVDEVIKNLMIIKARQQDSKAVKKQRKSKKQAKSIEAIFDGLECEIMIKYRARGSQCDAHIIIKVPKSKAGVPDPSRWEEKNRQYQREDKITTASWARTEAVVWHHLIQLSEKLRDWSSYNAMRQATWPADITISGSTNNTKRGD